MAYKDDKELALLEELYHRALDLDESDASGGALFIKRQAQRITEYRAEQDRKSQEWEVEQKQKKRENGAL